MYSSAQNCKIYVGNLPDYIRPRDIEEVFWKFGRIRNVDLHDRSRGPPFAFVEFDDERGAEDAVHYRNGYDFEGYRLRVEAPRTPKYLSRPSRDRDPYDRLGDPWGYPPRSSRQLPPPRRRLRSSSRRGEFRVTVSGLPRSASWQDLKDHFREAGEIAYTDVSSDGTGVLEFSSRKAMDYAVKHFDDKKFRSHQGESSYIRVRVCRKSRKSLSRSRSRTRSRERRSHSRSKSRSPHRSKRSRSRERDDSRNRDKSEAKKRNRSSQSGSRRGRDSLDLSRENSLDSRDQDDSPRCKKPRKDCKRNRSDSLSSADDLKVHRKSRHERVREDSKGSVEDSSRENSIERSPSKSSDRSMKESASPVPNSQFAPEMSEERTPGVSPEVSPERQVHSKSESRASSPQDSSESRKSTPSSSPSGSPLGNSNSSSPEHNQETKDSSYSFTEGLNENGAEELEVAKGGELEKEDSLSDETQ
ncbi:Serine/arginine-rich splicing factor 1 isoform X1 [Oopsacas minuta]|uniref:Serine/arginine-rich splicing factor 1 isoform X1 n=1 Tax=Oopsacas minuta TaxID=111878 RepID=A0AAV7JRG3_9METZ|nr:Serine/arginine-rich splicing factor 1 isoform X1 [Oopsacas minuta]